MITLLARWRIKPGHADQVLDALRRMAPLVAANEPGCLLYHANRSRDDENVILLYERYTDLDAIAVHRDTAHFREIVGGFILPLIEHRESELFDAVIG